MPRDFGELLTNAKKFGRITISVAGAQDRDVLQAIKAAQDADLAKAILIGDAGLIRPLLTEVGLPAETPIVHEADISKAALTAVSLVKRGEAQVLMKGLVNSGDFLKAVLDSEEGLRTNRLLSHLSAYEVPGETKLVFYTDGGMNIAPSLEEKKDILANALLALKSLGVQCPNVAVLAANEVVSAKMPATVDAKALVDMSLSEGYYPCIIEGPIAMDVALSPEAARHKGIVSKVSGKVDLFMVPSIEAGNILSKALIHYAKFKIAGVIVGATNPIVMVSRADTAEAKLNSIVLACCLAAAGK